MSTAKNIHEREKNDCAETITIFSIWKSSVYIVSNFPASSISSRVFFLFRFISLSKGSSPCLLVFFCPVVRGSSKAGFVFSEYRNGAGGRGEVNSRIREVVRVLTTSREKGSSEMKLASAPE